MFPPTCNSPTLSSCGKRPRTPETPVVPSFRESIEDVEDEPFAKMLRSSVQSTNANTNKHDRFTPHDENGNETLPLAPRLSDYMAPGGTVRYRPRPEWYLPKNSTTNRKNPPNADEDLELEFSQRHRHFAATGPTVREPDVYDDLRAGQRQRNQQRQEQEQQQEEEEEQQQHDEPPVAAIAISNNNNPSLHVAPADGLLPEGAFQDYSVGREAVGTGGGGGVDGESPPAVGSSSTRTSVSASPKQRAVDTLLVDAFITPATRKTSQAVGAAVATENTNTAIPTKPCFFGKDWDTALNLAIRENTTEAALVLLACGAAVDSENAKGITPLILASQKGNCTVVRELLSRGANPGTSSTNGTTALLQAAHFGHGNVVELLLLKGGPGLMELSNYNHTTPLMRASQEGHLEICRSLLASGAQVNRRNRVNMTAMMLGAQRGHAKICQLLIDYGAELDAMTASQQSTSLLLACKRGNVEVVRVLVTAGCELWIRDSKGRTAREIARRREHKELADLLDETMQVNMMQRKGRREQSFEMVRLCNLFQQERAKVEVEEDEMVSIHQINSTLERESLPFVLTLTSTRVLLQAMTLPNPLVESIAQYLPLPHLWSKRMAMLTKRSLINPDSAVISSLDLIDEILEEGGYLAACDAAQVTPPTHFESWNDWKAWARRRGQVAPSQPDNRMVRPNVTTATVPSPRNPEAPTFIELRRQVGFLQILANRSTSLARVLGAPPYMMPPLLIQQLITSSDIASLTRRMGLGGVHFESSVAMDLVMLISRLCAWYWRERERSTGVE